MISLRIWILGPKLGRHFFFRSFWAVGRLKTPFYETPYSKVLNFYIFIKNLGGDETDKFSQGLCEAYALLDSAYFLSHLVPIFIVSLLIELTHSPLSYAACSAVFGGLGVLAATQVNFLLSFFSYSQPYSNPNCHKMF